MNDLRRIVFWGVGALMIGLQIGYLGLCYGTNAKMMAANSSQVTKARLQLEKLEHDVANLHHIQEEIKLLDLQKAALENRIPCKQSVGEQTIELVDYLAVQDFNHVHIEALSETVVESQVGNLLKKEYELSYETSYEASRRFIKNLLDAYQVIQISSCEMSAIQADSQQLSAFASDDLVETRLIFATYIRPQEQEKVADVSFYMPDYINAHIFEDDYMLEDVAINVGGVVDEVGEYNQSKFKINIGDLLNEAGTYQVIGPEMSEDEVIKSFSEGDATIKIYIQPNQYTLHMTTQSGQSQVSKKALIMQEPLVVIDSTMRPILETMPNVAIHIINTSSECVSVQLKGSMLDHIHLYDEEGQILTKDHEKIKWIE